jgi:hypothetical protein
MALGLWTKAQQQYDYFMAGVSFGLVGYLSSQLPPSALALDASTVETSATVLLLGGAFCACKRLAATVTLQGIVHRRLYAEESAGSFAQASLSRGPLINIATGDVMTPAQAARVAQAAMTAQPEIERAQSRWAKACERWAIARDATIILGLAALISARVMKGYGL